MVWSNRCKVPRSVKCYVARIDRTVVGTNSGTNSDEGEYESGNEQGKTRVMAQ
jgi:hypothetical protein